MAMRWARYAEGRSVDLLPIHAEVYELAVSALHHDLGSGRRADVLGRLLLRARVDAHPESAALRELLDDRSSYPSGRMERAAASEPDVIRLLRIRQELAEREGFASYGHLVAHCGGYDPDRMAALMRRRRAEALASLEARTTAGPVDDWFDRIAATAGPRSFEALIEATSVAARLGLSEAADRISFHVEEQSISGYDCPVSVPDDVRILLAPSVTGDGLTTVFHELGHGLASAANEADGVFRTENPLYNESMAVLIEVVGRTIALQDDEARTAARIEEMEVARMTTSYLFEVDVNRTPTEARDLYVDWYEVLGDVPHPTVWALDSFRSEDPFHINSYVIGYLVAHAVVAHLRSVLGDDHRDWGEWLRSTWFAEGRRRSFFDKLNDLGPHRPDDVMACRGRGRTQGSSRSSLPSGVR